MLTWILAPVPATPLMLDGSSAGIAMSPMPTRPRM